MRLARTDITAQCAAPAPTPSPFEGEGWGEGSAQRLVSIASVVLLATAVSFSSIARADNFALLAPSGPADLTPAIRASAIDTLVVALRASGHRGTLPADVARQLSAARGAECVALDCARSVITTLHVDGVIETVLWSDGTGGVREVVVSIARASGAETSGTADIGPGGLTTAVRAALTQALSATGGAAAPVRLVVRVSPRGAALTLDGRPLGEAPWEGLLPPGHHVLVAGHVGFNVERRELELRADPIELAIELTRDPSSDVAGDGHAADGAAVGDGAAPGDGARGGRRTTSRAVVGPIVLGAVGAALIGFDIGALVYAGGEPPVGFERTLDPLPFVLYGAAGLGALAGALLWWLFSGDDTAADPQPAPLRVALDLRSASFSLTF